MGLTRTAAPDAPAPGERVIALAGNPNVGKSTLFNALTGMRQHTGNWPGKTVELARGRCASEGRRYLLVDLPGTYSLLAHSPEEEVARDFLCFGGAEAAVVVCDATALERNLNLVLQILELCPRTLVCVNLLDEAARKGLKVDLPLLADRLGVPVVGTSARDRTSQARLLSALDALMEAPEPQPRPVRYSAALESAAALLESVLAPLRGRGLAAGWRCGCWRGTGNWRSGHSAPWAYAFQACRASPAPWRRPEGGWRSSTLRRSRYRSW